MTRATKDAFIAANRFGLGPRPGELARIAPDPQGWLRRQVATPPAVPVALAGRPGSEGWLQTFLEARRSGVAAIKKQAQRRGRPLVFDELQAHIEQAVRSETPLVERLTQFWANHFTISGQRFFVAPIVGAFEREAIRPHVFGRFVDMLLAATRHPAMLLYLDNAASVGPNSRPGRRRERGLNENLAREILELHTLGVEGGYRQNDVIALAKILTGWSVGGVIPRQRITGRFHFLASIHEPGRKTLLGREFRDDGYDEGVAALRLLAGHPATARHIATKLARHFVADDPPADAVSNLERAFRDSGGDLAAVTRALITLPQVWATATPKVKSHYGYLVAIARALAVDSPPKEAFRGALHQMGQVPFMAPSPAGWPDRAADWLTPEALMRRLEVAQAVARRTQRAVDPERLLDDTIAAVAPSAVRRQILDAASAADAVALTLASATFQRR